MSASLKKPIKWDAIKGIFVSNTGAKLAEVAELVEVAKRAKALADAAEKFKNEKEAFDAAYVAAKAAAPGTMMPLSAKEEAKAEKLRKEIAAEVEEAAANRSATAARIHSARKAKKLARRATVASSRGGRRTIRKRR